MTSMGMLLTAQYSMYATFTMKNDFLFAGFPGPTFKAKLEDMAVGVGETITLCCHMMGPPMPTVAWYRNEELLSDATRTKIGVCGDGRAYLTLSNVKEYDTGIYKCVARNKYGRSSCRCRLMIGGES